MIRRRRAGLQVQVYAGRDPLTGRKRYVSQQVAGRPRPPCARPSRSRPGCWRGSAPAATRLPVAHHAELLEHWQEWPATVRPIAPTTVSSYRAAMDRYILPAPGKLPVRQVEALALAMEVSVLEAKRLGHRAVLRLSWLLLAASVALSTLLQVAVAPPTLVGYLTAGATPVWLHGSFAVLSLLYRAEISTDQTAAAAEPSAEQRPATAERQQPGAEVVTKRAQAQRAYAELSADGSPVSAGQLAAAAGLGASYARALLAEFQAQPPAALQYNGHRPVPADAHPEAGP